jgi:hypothetical protein
MISLSRRVTAVLLACSFVGLAEGQDDAAPQKAKAIEQMRQVVKVIKQCPGKVDRESPFPSNNQCFSSEAATGPPVNAIWDAHESRTARAPFEGWVEFDLPGSWSDHQLHPADRKVAKVCDRNSQTESEVADILAQAMLRVALGVGDDVELPRSQMWHYRFEFDVGSDNPELVKMLWTDQSGKAQPVTDTNSCWVKAAQSIGTAGADVRTQTSKP